MKRQRKVYARPKKPWSKERIDSENKLLEEYGLRRKREIWITEAKLRSFRRRAREIASTEDKEEEKILMKKISELGLIGAKAHLDDVLALKIEDLLDRRLQTIVFRKGIGSTQSQSRQFIVHGHIAIDGRRITWPSALVSLEQENKIAIYSNSKLKDSISKLKVRQPKKKEKTKEIGATSKEKPKEGKVKPVSSDTDTKQDKKETKTEAPKPETQVEKVVEEGKEVVEKVVEEVKEVVEKVAEKVKEIEKVAEKDVKKIKKEAEKDIKKAEKEIKKDIKEVEKEAKAVEKKIEKVIKEEIKKDVEKVKEKVTDKKIEEKKSVDTDASKK